MNDNIVIDFLNNTDWDNARIEWRKADWSPRDFARLYKGDKTAILLKSPPDHCENSMIGHQLGQWVLMQGHFTSLGLNVPDIYAQDLNQGLILMQDFGDETIADTGVEAYLKATDILITMRDHKGAITPDFIKYEDSHVYQALRFYPQYCLSSSSRVEAKPEPRDLIQNNQDSSTRLQLNRNDDLMKDWFSAWKEVESALPPCPRALTHMDFAAMNLMWQDGEIGIIDFQAACNGPFVYDIVNLLEDIRRDIHANIKTACKEKYCEGLQADDIKAFHKWYPIITAQFYARILGQIQFLSKEKGRTDLMQYYESTKSRLEKLLQWPELEQIKNFTAMA